MRWWDRYGPELVLGGYLLICALLSALLFIFLRST
jgi:hypothetical protein